MNISKMVVGTLLCIAGIALGLYVGLWWAFIGGIVDVVNAVKAPEIQSMAIAIGVAKVVCAGFLGGISAICFIVPGAAMVKAA